jgi:hypothetical protein
MTARVTMLRAMSAVDPPCAVSCATRSFLASTESSWVWTCSRGIALSPMNTAVPAWVGPPHPLITAPMTATAATTRPTCMRTTDTLSRPA